MSKETTKKVEEVVAVAAPAVVEEKVVTLPTKAKGNKPALVENKEEQIETLVLKATTDLDISKLLTAEAKRWYFQKNKDHTGEVVINGQKLDPILANIPADKISELCAGYQSKAHDIHEGYVFWDEKKEEEKAKQVDVVNTFSMYAFKVKPADGLNYHLGPQDNMIDSIIENVNKDEIVQLLFVDNNSSVTITKSLSLTMYSDEMKRSIKQLSVGIIQASTVVNTIFGGISTIRGSGVNNSIIVNSSVLDDLRQDKVGGRKSNVNYFNLINAHIIGTNLNSHNKNTIHAKWLRATNSTLMADWGNIKKATIEDVWLECKSSNIKLKNVNIKDIEITGNGIEIENVRYTAENERYYSENRVVINSIFDIVSVKLGNNFAINGVRNNKGWDFNVSLHWDASNFTVIHTEPGTIYPRMGFGCFANNSSDINTLESKIATAINGLECESIKSCGNSELLDKLISLTARTIRDRMDIANQISLTRTLTSL